MREIGGDRLGANAVLGRERAREIEQLAFAPRDEHEVVPVRGRDPGELVSDAAGGAGDESGHGKRIALDLSLRVSES